MVPLPASCLRCAAEEKIIQCNLMPNLMLGNGMYQRHLFNLLFEHFLQHLEAPMCTTEAHDFCENENHTLPHQCMSH